MSCGPRVWWDARTRGTCCRTGEGLSRGKPAGGAQGAGQQGALSGLGLGSSPKGGREGGQDEPPRCHGNRGTLTREVLNQNLELKCPESAGHQWSVPPLLRAPSPACEEVPTVWLQGRGPRRRRGRYPRKGSGSQPVSAADSEVLRERLKKETHLC